MARAPLAGLPIQPVGILNLRWEQVVVVFAAIERAQGYLNRQFGVEAAQLKIMEDG